MTKTALFDLDGTLAIINERRKLSTTNQGKINWEEFLNPENISLDIPNQPIIEILNSLRIQGVKIIILSGRLETTKEATINWLKENKINYDELRMRPNTQELKFISDVKLKKSWLKEIGIENILCVFDDRTKLVQMWRSFGLTCLQVDQGDF